MTLWRRRAGRCPTEEGHRLKSQGREARQQQGGDIPSIAFAALDMTANSARHTKLKEERE